MVELCKYVSCNTKELSYVAVWLQLDTGIALAITNSNTFLIFLFRAAKPASFLVFILSSYQIYVYFTLFLFMPMGGGF